MKRVLTGLLVVALAGCSSLGSLATKAVTSAIAPDSGLSVDTELVAGDKEQQVVLGETLDASQKFDEVAVNDNATLTMSTTTTKKATDIDADNVVVNDGVKFYQVGLVALITLVIGLALGLFLPQYKINRKE